MHYQCNRALIALFTCWKSFSIHFLFENPNLETSQTFAVCQFNRKIFLTCFRRQTVEKLIIYFMEYAKQQQHSLKINIQWILYEKMELKTKGNFEFKQTAPIELSAEELLNPSPILSSDIMILKENCSLMGCKY